MLGKLLTVPKVSRRGRVKLSRFHAVAVYALRQRKLNEERIEQYLIGDVLMRS